MWTTIKCAILLTGATVWWKVTRKNIAHLWQKEAKYMCMTWQSETPCPYCIKTAHHLTLFIINRCNNCHLHVLFPTWDCYLHICGTYYTFSISHVAYLFACSEPLFQHAVFHSAFLSAPYEAHSYHLICVSYITHTCHLITWHTFP